MVPRLPDRQPVVRATGRHDAHRYQGLEVDLGRAQMLVAEGVLNVLERNLADRHVHRRAVAHPVPVRPLLAEHLFRSSTSLLWVSATSGAAYHRRTSLVFI